MNKLNLLRNYNTFLAQKFNCNSEILEHYLQEYLAREDPVYELLTDGASSGNPGPAGAGLLIKHEDKTVFQISYALGYSTNNEAEYWALILGLHHLRKFAADITVHHTTDSELLARQIQGVYKVKNKRLQILWKTAQNLIKLFSKYEVTSLSRNHLDEADELAKKGSMSQETSSFEKIKEQLKAEGFLEERA